MSEHIGFQECARLYGGSVRDCFCRLPNEGGWLECPPEARGILVPQPLAEFEVARAEPSQRSASNLREKGFTGNVCGWCGSTNMIRTGTCETCQDCGEAAGGCV